MELTTTIEVTATEAAVAAFRIAPLGQKSVHASMAAAMVIARELSLPLNDKIVVAPASYRIGFEVAEFARIEREAADFVAAL